jgi:hypothetical protein
MSRTTRKIPGEMTNSLPDYLLRIQRGQAMAVSTIVCEHGWPEHVSGPNRRRIKRFVAKVSRRQARQDIKDSFMLG